VLCSEFADFNYARQGIILGAFDYFVKPFDVNLFVAMFSRIKNEVFENEAFGLNYTEEIASLFEKRSEDIYQYVDNVFNSIYEDESDFINADKMARQICCSVFDEMFKSNKWLELYVVQQDFYSMDGINESNKQSYKNRYKSIICNLFEEFSELYPSVNNEKIREVVMYILSHPENNLKQKNIASELYINSSYLSTVFFSQTGIRFVDYLNTVKLKRAGWLLKETDMKIIDIATRLDYKDIGYFSRLFKNKFGITPSGYRLPEEYDYQI
jgi:two-component system response regulator YesN